MGGIKRYISIFLLLILTWQTAFKFALIIYWETNQAYITQMFCENKDKPQMCCKGKCYLNKQLKKADEGESDSKTIPSCILKLKFIEAFIIQNDICLLMNSPCKQVFACSRLSNPLPGYHNLPFRPPRFI